MLDEGPGAAGDRQRTAGEIRAKVQGGASLADAVADISKKGATSAAVDLGWVSPGDLDKNLETAVWKLPKGAISDPVQARGGLHLVQVLDRRESHVPPFTEVPAAIQAKEQERVFKQEVAKYMVELEKKSLIVANPPAEAADFRRQLASQNGAEDRRSRPRHPGSNPAAPRRAGRRGHRAGSVARPPARHSRRRRRTRPSPPRRARCRSPSRSTPRRRRSPRRPKPRRRPPPPGI